MSKLEWSLSSALKVHAVKELYVKIVSDELSFDARG